MTLDKLFKLPQVLHPSSQLIPAAITLKKLRTGLLEEYRETDVKFQSHRLNEF